MSASLAEDTPWKQRMLAYTGMGQGFVKVKKKHFRVKKEIFQFCFGQTFKSQSRLVNLSFFFSRKTVYLNIVFVRFHRFSEL